MSDDDRRDPDDRLEEVPLPADDGPPEIYAISDLRAYVKPDLDEELGAPTGDPAVCGTEVQCSCVPVETCACNVVTYITGDQACTSHCPADYCVSLYWYPT